MAVERIWPAELNEELLAHIETTPSHAPDMMLIEMVDCYGMPVGKTVFETVRWIGIFEHAYGRDRTVAVYRRQVKMTLCGNMRAKDTNVRHALFDRFPETGGGMNRVTGTKAKPGPLYGLAKHAVSALAVGMAWWDKREEHRQTDLVATNSYLARLRANESVS
jgi:hypothetical protein